MLTERQLETRRRRNARRLDENHLDCRLLGHSWIRVADDPEADPPTFGVRLCFECVRCTSRRCDIVQRQRGNLLSRSYEYAEGYGLTSIEGERPVNAVALRFELIRRIEADVTPPGAPEIGEAP